MPTFSGQLRHCVSFIERRSESDSFGQVRKPERILERRAGVRRASSGVVEEGGEELLDQVYTMNTRYDEDLANVTPAWTVRWRGQEWGILQAVDPDGKGRRMEFQLTRLPAVAQGEL